VNAYGSAGSSSALKIWGALLCLLMAFSLLQAAPPTHYSLHIPLSLQRTIQDLIERYGEELEALWGLTLSFPIHVDIQRESGLSVRGEATFDGRLYTVFMTPSFLDLPFLLKHELMHLYNFEWIWRTQRLDIEGTEQRVIYASVPLWVMEGLAVWYEGRLMQDPRIAFPWEYRALIDFTRIEEYPQGQAHAQYYTVLSDFFREYDSRANLRERFRDVLRYVESGELWPEAFTKATGRDFEETLTRWKRGKMLAVWLAVFLDFLAAGIPLLLLFALFVLFFRRRNPVDTFGPEYEKKYGPSYWMASTQSEEPPNTAERKDGT